MHRLRQLSVAAHKDSSPLHVADSSVAATGVNFDDPKQCFQSKSSVDLVRSLAVFSICQTQLLVKHAEVLMLLSYRLFGHSFTNFFLKRTFFGHFCAGEDADLIRPTVEYLQSNGVGAILDYAAEVDIQEQQKAVEAEESTTELEVLSRTYDYQSEAQCDAHVETFENCIRAVYNVAPTGFAALKCTALGDPKLLENITVLIKELRNLFVKFDVDGSGKISREEFIEVYTQVFQSGDVEAIFKQLDVREEDEIDYVEWTNVLKIDELHELTQHCRERGPLFTAVLDENERALYKRMKERLRKLCALARSLNVRLMIDAEHTYYQEAISAVTNELAREFNTDYPVVFSTYQLYLKDGLSNLKTDLDRAKDGKYKFAAKLVRGAYMVLERKRARDMGYEDPILPTIEATHSSYNAAVEETLRRIACGEDLEIMIASHNQESVEKTVMLMNQMGVQNRQGVYFGTLLGMSDNLAFGLGSAGYLPYKYVPYGKIEEVMPYLIRRAQENSSALGGAQKEMDMIKSELWRRAKSTINMA